MGYDPELPGCFGEADLLFALHPLDAQRAFTWLAKLRERQATWGEARAQIEAFLRERDIPEASIAERVRAAEPRLRPWLWGE